MNSIKFSESVDIKGTPEQLFDFTQDYSTRLVWDTFLIEARLLGNASIAAKGVKAWCVSKQGLGMETEYVSFKRPSVAAVKMTRGPYMFKDFAASWRFKEEVTGYTRVTFVYSFSLRFPLNVANFITKGIFRRNVQRRLLDLKARFMDRGIATID